MKIFAFLVLIGLSALALSNSIPEKKPNLKIYYYKSGIDFVFDKLKEKLNSMLKGPLEIPKKTFNYRIMKVSISNYKIEDYNLPKISYSGNGNEATIDLFDESLKFSADWSYNFFWFSKSGKMTISTSESDIGMSFRVMANPPNKMIMKATNCKINLGQIKLSFGLWGFMDRIIENFAKNYLSDSLCPLVTNAMNNHFDSKLNNRDMEATIFKDIVFRYPLTKDAQFSNQMASFDHLGLALGYPEPQNPVLMQNHKPNSMFEVLLSEESMQSVWDTYYNKGHINYIIPVEQKILLDLCKKNKGSLKVKMTTDQKPQIKMKNGFVEMTTPLISEFIDTTNNETLLKIKSNYFVKVSLKFVDNKSKFNILNLTSTTQTLKNNIPGVNQNQIEKAIKDSDTENVANLNSKLSFSLPSFMGMTFKNTIITYFDGYMSIASDFGKESKFK